MRTAQQWLDLPIDELRIELAEAFDDPHKSEARGSPCWLCSIENCEGCGHYDIALDWNTAMEWRDWITRMIAPSIADEIFQEISKIENRCFVYGAEPQKWWLWNAQPKHYLIAAAMAAKKKSEGMSAREIAKFQKGVQDLR